MKHHGNSHGKPAEGGGGYCRTVKMDSRFLFLRYHEHMLININLKCPSCVHFFLEIIGIISY